MAAAGDSRPDGADRPVVRLEEVRKSYGALTAVAGVSLAVRRGETAATAPPRVDGAIVRGPGAKNKRPAEKSGQSVNFSLRATAWSWSPKKSHQLLSGRPRKVRP